MSRGDLASSPTHINYSKEAAQEIKVEAEKVVEEQSDVKEEAPAEEKTTKKAAKTTKSCLLYTSPSPRD